MMMPCTFILNIVIGRRECTVDRWFCIAELAMVSGLDT